MPTSVSAGGSGPAGAKLGGVTKANFFMGLRPPRPATSSSGEDPPPAWQTAWYLPRSTRTSPPPRSGQRPRGRVVLLIFIPQGWPSAMSHLPWIGGSAPCYPALSQLARHRGCRRNVLSREVRRHPGRLRVLDLRLRVVAHPSGRCRPGLFWLLTSARSSVALLTGRVTPGSMTAQVGEEHR
jgi:hypothetical protein